jgi:hypothetical protein
MSTSPELVQRQARMAVVGIAFLMLSGGGASGGPSVEVAASPWRFALVMSRDDALCRSIADLYNSLLQKVVTGPHRALTDFEVTMPDRFRAVGLAPLQPEQGTPEDGIFLADVFNDGHKRLVWLADSFVGANRVTYARILKEDVTPAQAAALLKESPDETGSPLVEMSANLLAGDTPQYDMNAYVLRYWPKLDVALQQFRSGQSEFAPVIASYATVRMFAQNGMTLFITNEYADAAFPAQAESLIVTYTMTPRGPSDLCYLHLPPTP